MTTNGNGSSDPAGPDAAYERLRALASGMFDDLNRVARLLIATHGRSEAFRRLREVSLAANAERPASLATVAAMLLIERADRDSGVSL